MKKGYLILIFFILLIFGNTTVFAETKYSVVSKTEAIGKYELRYELIKFSETRYKVLEETINNYVMNIIEEDKKFIEEKCEYLSFSGGTEIFFNIESANDILNINVMYWDSMGASPYYISKSFTYNLVNNEMVNLSDITGLSGKEILEEILRQYNEQCTVYEPVTLTKEENFYENLPFVITDDGKIMLIFTRDSIFGKPEYDFYLKFKN